MDATCPRCDPPAPLAAHSEGAVTLDLCDGCGGVFVDADEWAALMGGARDVAAPPSVSLGERPRCPKCGDRMHPFGLREAPAVEIDVCQGCGGTWLDPYELAEIQSALAAARARATPPPTAGTQPARGPRVRASFAVSEAESLTFLEALVDTWRTLWRR